MTDPPSANDELLDRVIRHQVYLERFKTSELPRLINVLDELDDELTKRLEDIDPETDKAKRLEAKIRKVEEISDQAVERYGEALAGTLGDTAEYEAGWISAAIAATAGAEFLVTVGLDIVTPDPNLLRAAVTSRPLQGRLLKEWVENLAAARRGRLAAAIRNAAIESATIDELIRRIRGTRAGGFKDGILEISRRGAEGLARTALQHISNEARRMSYEENSAVVKQVQWVSTLDSRTTPYCRAMDGKRFPIDKGPRPPAHINCRSTTVPVLKSWAEIGIDAGEISEGTRASMNGQVPDTLTYDTWLRRQPAEFQDEVLGKSKAELFRNGLTMERFVDLKTQHAFTLDELREREPALWTATFGGKTARAGFDPSSLGEADPLPVAPAYRADIPGEEGFAYHVTTRDGLFGVQDDGKLDVFEPWHGTDQDSWPDGSIDARIYLAKNPRGTEPFQQENPVLLRTAMTPDIRQERGTPDLFTEKPIPAWRLEFLGDDGAWHPVAPRPAAAPDPGPSVAESGFFNDDAMLEWAGLPATGPLRTFHSIAHVDSINTADNTNSLRLMPADVGLDAWPEPSPGSSSRTLIFRDEAARDAFLVSLPAAQRAKLAPVEVRREAVHAVSRDNPEFFASSVEGMRFYRGIVTSDVGSTPIYARDPATGLLVGAREIVGSGRKAPNPVGKHDSLDKAEKAVEAYLDVANEDKHSPKDQRPGTIAYERMAAIDVATGEVLWRHTDNVANAVRPPPAILPRMGLQAHEDGTNLYAARSVDIWHNHPTAFSPLSVQDVIFATFQPEVREIIARDAMRNTYRARVHHLTAHEYRMEHMNVIHGEHRAMVDTLARAVRDEFEELWPIIATVDENARIVLAEGTVSLRDAIRVGFARHMAWRALDELDVVDYRATLTGVAKQLDDRLNEVLAEVDVGLLTLLEEMMPSTIRRIREYVANNRLLFK